ncbi:hypothetical protein Nepgr_000003 [Nepenthes gracilis]|uniref:Uncharacterized protein n=1 Tax=Nepenthes gracilis TaxID=150966 RepID=A0AAD3P5F7_NEPGR|nr:hypothetical protein Nepgr_000003 [Nepenthes gracilis]
MEVESLLRGDFVPFSCNYLDSGCQREGAVDSFSYKTHEVLSAKDQMKDHNNCKMNALADEEFLYDIQGKNANFWNATSPLLYDSFLNTEYDITWKSSGSADSFGINNYNMQDFLSHLPKRGPEKSIDRYHVLDSYAQYLKHQTMEDLHFLTSRESKYSAFGRNSDSPSSQYSWSYLIAEDARDSLRSLSEA